MSRNPIQIDLFASQAEPAVQVSAPLQYLLDASGLTLDALIAEIERAQPSNSINPTNRMGLGRELGDLVMRATGKTIGCIPAWRALQHLVCTRPWTAG